ncbi:unnamed protein product [Didymodactylos carnosus]|uniref:Uncharacterized protein n=1 Tax=Didymodactylos carnosus TaxID=1234261 RepID=A0A814C905_9BILA|nr:unnamed protein product [Didymodactylos carnosus]CAF3714062.1 unnamed protein product [Didymodactylos carnosus]
MKENNTLSTLPLESTERHQTEKAIIDALLKISEIVQKTEIHRRKTKRQQRSLDKPSLNQLKAIRRRSATITSKILAKQRSQRIVRQQSDDIRNNDNLEELSLINDDFYRKTSSIMNNNSQIYRKQQTSQMPLKILRNKQQYSTLSSNYTFHDSKATNDLAIGNKKWTNSLSTSPSNCNRAIVKNIATFNNRNGIDRQFVSIWPKGEYVDLILLDYKILSVTFSLISVFLFCLKDVINRSRSSYECDLHQHRHHYSDRNSDKNHSHQRTSKSHKKSVSHMIPKSFEQKRRYDDDSIESITQRNKKHTNSSSSNGKYPDHFSSHCNSSDNKKKYRDDNYSKNSIDNNKYRGHRDRKYHSSKYDNGDKQHSSISQPGKDKNIQKNLTERKLISDSQMSTDQQMAIVDNFQATSYLDSTTVEQSVINSQQQPLIAATTTATTTITADTANTYQPTSPIQELEYQQQQQQLLSSLPNAETTTQIIQSTSNSTTACCTHPSSLSLTNIDVFINQQLQSALEKIHTQQQHRSQSLPTKTATFPTISNVPPTQTNYMRHRQPRISSLACSRLVQLTKSDTTKMLNGVAKQLFPSEQHEKQRQQAMTAAKNGDFELSYRLYTKLYHDTQDIELKSDVLSSRATTLLLEQKCYEAIEDCTHAIAFNQWNKLAYVIRAACWMIISQYEKAVEDYSKLFHFFDQSQQVLDLLNLAYEQLNVLREQNKKMTNTTADAGDNLEEKILSVTEEYKDDEPIVEEVSIKTEPIKSTKLPTKSSFKHITNISKVVTPQTGDMQTTNLGITTPTASFIQPAVYLCYPYTAYPTWYSEGVEKVESEQLSSYIVAGGSLTTVEHHRIPPSIRSDVQIVENKTKSVQSIENISCQTSLTSDQYQQQQQDFNTKKRVTHDDEKENNEYSDINIKRRSQAKVQQLEQTSNSSIERQQEVPSIHNNNAVYDCMYQSNLTSEPDVTLKLTMNQNQSNLWPEYPLIQQQLGRPCSDGNDVVRHNFSPVYQSNSSYENRVPALISELEIPNCIRKEKTTATNDNNYVSSTTFYQSMECHTNSNNFCHLQQNTKPFMAQFSHCHQVKPMNYSSDSTIYNSPKDGFISEQQYQQKHNTFPAALKQTIQMETRQPSLSVYPQEKNQSNLIWIKNQNMRTETPTNSERMHQNINGNNFRQINENINSNVTFNQQVLEQQRTQSTGVISNRPLA